MKNLRFLFPVVTAFVVASFPVVALADAWIHGTGNLWPQSPAPKPCSIRGQTFQCPLGMRQQANIRFKNKKTGATCLINVHRVAKTFGDRWDVEHAGTPGPCTIHSKGSNTFEIREEK